MGLESSVTKISDLNPLWPLGSDQKLAGDDHIRNIKLALQTIPLLKNIVTFTSSGTWNRPAGVSKILVYCLGGGAGGGGGTVGGYSGGGGGGGATALKWIDVAAIPSATVTIGYGGAGGAVAAAVGANGFLTSFVSAGAVTHCQAREGLAAPFPYMGGDAQPRGNSIGDIIFTGTPGHFGSIPSANATQNWGGSGGGIGGNSDHPAQANSGGGGGGGNAMPSSASPGQAGGSGYCIILEFGV